jgi:hypothetical protein
MDLEEDKEEQRAIRQNQKPYLSVVDTLTINAGRVWGFPPSFMCTGPCLEGSCTKLRGSVPR